jgi:hypothetical protein
MWHSRGSDHDLFENVAMETLLFTMRTILISLFVEWNAYSIRRERDVSLRLQRELWSRQIQIPLLLSQIKSKVNMWSIHFLWNCCWIQYKYQSMMHDLDNLLSAWFCMNAHKFNASHVYVTYHCVHGRRWSMLMTWILRFQLRICRLLRVHSSVCNSTVWLLAPVLNASDSLGVSSVVSS